MRHYVSHVYFSFTLRKITINMINLIICIITLTVIILVKNIIIKLLLRPKVNIFISQRSVETFATLIHVRTCKESFVTNPLS